MWPSVEADAHRLRGYAYLLCASTILFWSLVAFSDANTRYQLRVRWASLSQIHAANTVLNGEPAAWLDPVPALDERSCMPHLLGIGAQKAGTDFLYGIIAAARYHPALLPPVNIKEVHFFDWRMDKGENDIKWYMRQFPAVAPVDDPLQGQCSRDGQQGPVVRMEVTPAYLFHPLVPQRVKEHLPQVRLLVLLRDPVSRAISCFNHNWHQGQIRDRNVLVKGAAEGPHWLNVLNNTLQGELQVLSNCYRKFGGKDRPMLTAVWRCLRLEGLQAEEVGRAIRHIELLWRSIYVDQLARWMQLFPPQQFLLWITEDFVRGPEAHMQQLVRWLGLDTDQIQSSDMRKAAQFKHAQPYPAQAPAQLLEQLTVFLRPHSQRLQRFLRVQGMYQIADRLPKVWPSMQ